MGDLQLVLETDHYDYVCESADAETASHGEVFEPECYRGCF